MVSTSLGSRVRQPEVALVPAALARPTVAFDRVLRLFCTIWVGVMAGFFWAFSFAVMPGLERTEPLAAMAAMQGINAVVRNAVFAIGFFGAPALCLAALVRALIRRRDAGSWFALAGAVVYVVGVFVVTFAFNVPLNEELAGLDPALPQNAGAMTAYITDWNVWNDVRTATGLVALVLFAASLLVGRPPQETDGSTARG